MLNKCELGYLSIICEIKDCNYGCFNIIIYNSNGEIVFNDYLSNKKPIKFLISESGKYRIQVCSARIFTPMCINSWVTIKKYKNYCKYFCFNVKESCKHKKHITLKLTDQNYSGLPITRGKISLWQNIM